MRRLFRKRRMWRREVELRDSYDVVIIGGGSHGLAIAYYLARDHGITDVCVLEKRYIGSGAAGRNTAILRSNYRNPESARFYDASLRLYEGLSAELGFNLLFSQQGHLTLAHTDRAMFIMAERAENNPKIDLVWNTVVEEILGDDETGVTGVRLKSTLDDTTREQEAAGAFMAIGHTPNTLFLEGKLEMTAKKYLKWTVPFRTNTSVEGVFAAGDVADDYYRQAVTAAGTGCMAALDAERWLGSKGF